MEFRVLGPVEVRRDGDGVDLGGYRQRAVLSRLLVARNDVVGVDRLLDDLWDGNPATSALGVLQAYVSNLRRVLEPDRAPRTPAQVLVSQPPGYALIARTDADEFGELLSTGIDHLERGDAAAAVSTLTKGLELWRGDPYADVADEPWAQAEMARLVELRLIADEHRLAAELALGRAHAAIPDLEALVAGHPLREGLWRLLALALYRTSRQADALDALRKARTMLADELGLDPSPDLQALEAAVLAQDPQLAATAPTRAVEAAPRATTAGDEQVFGRDRPLAVLHSAADTALAGRPQNVVITGDAGIGKTWLVRAFSDELSAQGWTAVWGQSHETSGAPALWPWLQILAELDRDHPVPEELRTLLDGSARSAGGDTADARFRQHDQIRRYLQQVASVQPLLLVFDDLHWADAASIHLLADVFTLSRSGRLLAMVMTRPSEEVRDSPALVRLDRNGQRVTLGGLDIDAIAELAAASGHELPVALLTQRSGGNPLFVREILRLVDQAGVDDAMTRVPDSVGDLVRQRLTGFSAQTQTVLQVAAVCGHDVEPDIVGPVSGQTEAQVWDALDSAVRAGILVETDAGLRFAHDLMRETLYADLAPLQRSRMHARVVETLERLPVTSPARLAEHAYAAGPIARTATVRWSIAAAEQAANRLAYADAVRWWDRAQQAYQLMPDGNAEVHLGLLMSLLRAHLDNGDAVASRETRNRALLVADATGDASVATRALVALDAPALWLLRQFNELELGLVARLERVLAGLPAEDSELRCRVLATLASELYDSEPDPRCEQLAGDAVAMARRIGDPALLVVALNARHHATNREGNSPHAVATAEELIELGTANSWPNVVVLGHLMAPPALFIATDLARADEHAANAERLIRRLDLQVPRMQALAYRAARLQIEGRFEEADAALDEFAGLGLSWWAMDGLTAAQRLTQLFLADRWDDIDDELITTASWARPSLAHDMRLLRDGGGQPSWVAPVHDWAWLPMTIVRSETAARFGDDTVRRCVYRELSPYAGLFAFSASFGAPVDWYLARLASVLGDIEVARRHLLGLVALCERESLDWWADRARTTLDGLG